MDARRGCACEIVHARALYVGPNSAFNQECAASSGGLPTKKNRERNYLKNKIEKTPGVSLSPESMSWQIRPHQVSRFGFI